MTASLGIERKIKDVLDVKKSMREAVSLLLVIKEGRE